MERNKTFRSCEKNGKQAIVRVEVDETQFSAEFSVIRVQDGIGETVDSIEGPSDCDDDFELSHEDFSAHIKIARHESGVPDIRCTWK